MKNMSREWEVPEVRKQILHELENVDDIEVLYKLLDRIESAFSDPW